MLQTIRDRATGWIAYIIVGLLIVPFALWGVHQYQGGPQVDAAVVGDETITLQEFQRAYQGAVRDQPADTLNETALKQQVLDRLINARLLQQVARTQGLRVGDAQLNAAVLNDSRFQQGGRFDPEVYERVLRFQGYSKAMYEELLRWDLAVSQLRDGIIATSLVTQADLERAARVLMQKRDLAYLVLSRDDYRETVAVSDEEIQAYFQANRDRFRNPEQVKLRYLELQVDALAQEGQVSEAELRQAYEEQRARFVKEEQRDASHILINVTTEADEDSVAQARARARDLYDRIQSGEESFDSVMQAAQEGELEGAEGGELGTIEKGLLDPVFEETLYGLASRGAISEPVRTPFGFHLIRLDKINAGEVQSLDEVRGELARDIRQRRAENRYYDMAETLANLTYEHPDNLETAAQALDLPIQESPWLTRSGGEGIGAHPQVMEAAFSEDVLREGLNSTAIELDSDQVVVVRVAEHQEATPQTLDQARERISAVLKAQKVDEALEQRAEELRERLARGEAPQALAEAAEVELQNPGPVSRTQGGLDPALMQAVFQAPRPQGEDRPATGTVSLSDGDRAVFVISAVEPGSLEDMSEPEREALSQQLAFQGGVGQFRALLDSLREKTDVVTFTDRL